MNWPLLQCFLSFCSAFSVVKAHRVQDGAVKPCTKGKSVSVATNRPFWLINLLPLFDCMLWKDDTATSDKQYSSKILQVKLWLELKTLYSQLV